MRSTIYILYVMVCMVTCSSCGVDNHKDTEAAITSEEAIDTIPTLIRQIQECSRLYTSEYNIRKIVTHSDQPRLKAKVLGHDVDMPMAIGDRKIAIPINVTLKAFIDFEGFSQDNIRREGRHITLYLPEPQVTVTASKVDQRGIKEYVSFTRSRFSDAEMSEFERQGRDAVVKSIPSLDIYETAKLSAAQLLIPMVMKIGYDEHEVKVMFYKEIRGDKGR